MMIKSILDNDLYKFTTSYAYMKLFPHAEGTFTFIDRSNKIITDDIYNEILNELYSLKYLKLTYLERRFMQNKCYYIPPSYLDWLERFKFDFANKSRIYLKEGKLHIEVTGLLYDITLYEVPILAIISEIYTKYFSSFDFAKMIADTVKKADYADINDIKFSEFGTRRRISFEVQNSVVRHLQSYAKDVFTGTSNCLLAYNYNLTPIGTHPHEWFMFHGAMYGYDQANYLALENWINTYDGDLGIALTDTYTTNVFFKNFSKKHAKLFDGVRQDSGDPFVFVDKTIKRYKSLNINPMHKTIIFSDGLNFEKANKIKEYCSGKINCAFGIGTNLTNDSKCPPNIVMKLTSCKMNKNQPLKQCVKLSDVNGKNTGDSDEIALAQMIIDKHYGIN